ncbi:helix-turn-helix transcriptional regulator [Novosphingobium capsulatum]|uniref:helix-turn-helix domain-containing protein n=1 Tax=Novosphingobium capsulatum TaxID=13688 RepID=UPI002E1066F4|nr:helix-turn-helix transcriptional regulator [Novosphingobium capsulatum]
MTSQTITYKLRNWRRQHGLSQAAAAQRMNVARRTWHQWERGTVIPRAEHIRALMNLTAGAVAADDFFVDRQEAA